MAYFIVKLINNDSIRITDKEYSQLGGKNGLVYFPSNKETINTASITHIIPEEIYEDGKRKRLLENRHRSSEGILHDGTKVVRYFGNWYVAGQLDANGKPDIVCDPTYYQEIAKDCVPTPEEFHKEYEFLPRKERLTKMLGSVRDYTRNNTPFGIGKIIENKLKELEDKNDLPNLP